VNATKRAKAHAHVRKAAWMNNIPEFNVMDYNISLIKWLNFFNVEVPMKDKQAWVISYWKSQGKVTKGLEKLTNGFNQCATLIKLKEQGYSIESNHEKFLESHYQTLFKRTKQPVLDENGNEVEDPDVKAKLESESKKTVSIQERTDKLLHTHLAEFDAAIDELCTAGTEFDTKSYLLTNQVKSAMAKDIGDYIKIQLTEWETTLKGKDPQLNEGYGHYDKKGLKQVISFLSDAMNECFRTSIISKTTRAPIKKREKPAASLVSKMKYLKEFPDYKMRSLQPEKLIGASTVILFDTKFRKLIQYESLEGSTLTVNGATLKNFDPEKSFSKTVRKVEILDGVHRMTKRPFTALMKGINSVEAKVTGRVNENQIILSVFN
jgi:hypothetical protein